MILASTKGVTHEYLDAGQRVRALEDVSLSIEPGELVLVLGPSGSGKSTLLAVLAGLLRPTAGSVTLCGASVSSMDESERARVRREHAGFVFQSFHLFPALSAAGNVECVLRMRGLAQHEARAKARAALGEVGLENRLTHKPGQLSGGERQRVALARALAARPRIVLGDEPTSALDSRTAADVVRLLRAFVGPERGVVLATHDARLLAHATRVITMEDGRILSDERRP